MLVATPGRLIDHLNAGRVKLNTVHTLVLDEADRMLDMGFIEDIETIIGRSPESRQTLLPRPRWTAPWPSWPPA